MEHKPNTPDATEDLDNLVTRATDRLVRLERHKGRWRKIRRLGIGLLAIVLMVGSAGFWLWLAGKKEGPIRVEEIWPTIWSEIRRRTGAEPEKSSQGDEESPHGYPVSRA